MNIWIEQGRVRHEFEDIYRKIKWGRIAMMLDQGTAHHTFFRLSLEYGLIFKLGKEMVTD